MIIEELNGTDLIGVCKEPLPILLKNIQFE